MKIQDIRKMKRQISGFGGSYEKTCRNCVIKGVQWLEKHPEANPIFDDTGFIPKNNDAKELRETMFKDEDDITVAMAQATIAHVLFIKKHGLEEYLKQMNSSLGKS